MVVSLTFLTAFLAYAGLSAGVLLSAYGRWPKAGWKMIALIAVLHVLLVWAYRYEWQWSQATRNGYSGFLIFHTALAAIVASAMVGKHAALLLAQAGFAAVTIGAVGAVFRYEVVAVYRVPVIGCALLGSWGLLVRRWRWRREQARAA